MTAKFQNMQLWKRLCKCRKSLGIFKTSKYPIVENWFSEMCLIDAVIIAIGWDCCCKGRPEPCVPCHNCSMDFWLYLPLQFWQWTAWRLLLLIFISPARGWFAVVFSLLWSKMLITCLTCAIFYSKCYQIVKKASWKNNKIVWKGIHSLDGQFYSIAERDR